MKSSKNDITGDSLKSKETSDSYRDNYDKIMWGEKKNQNQYEFEGMVGDVEEAVHWGKSSSSYTKSSN
jgi:hypothetical protein